MATISFSQSSFDVVENEAVIVIGLVRSGDTTSEVVVLIGSHPYQGSAIGVFGFLHVNCTCKNSKKFV